MNNVFAKTRELADAIMQSDVYLQMRAAEETAMHNPEASAILGEYMEIKNSVELLLQSPEPDPSALKDLSEKMDNCQERLQLIDDIVQLTQAREAFGNLIGQINQLLRFIVSGQMDESDGGCGGSCDSCGSCSSCSSCSH